MVIVFINYGGFQPINHRFWSYKLWLATPCMFKHHPNGNDVRSHWVKIHFLGCSWLMNVFDLPTIDEYVASMFIHWWICYPSEVHVVSGWCSWSQQVKISWKQICKCNVIVLWYIIVRHHFVVDHESYSHFILSLDLSSKPVRIRDNFEWIPRFMWCACCKSHLGMIVATPFMVLGMVYGRWAHY